jgi:hypothetical protein
VQDPFAINHKIHLPAEAIDSLRDGLRGQLATAAQELTYADGLSGGSEHPERYQGPLRSIDTLRALLDEIGWSGQPSDLWIDLRLHGRALTLALEDQISGHAELLRDSNRDEGPREAVIRSMNSLTALALVTLLRIQAHILRSAKLRDRPAGEAYAGFL